MNAMALTSAGARTVTAVDLRTPAPGPFDVLIKVLAYGVCRTDLHVVDGDLPDPILPIVPGHEIVGIVQPVGSSVAGLAPGARVGVPWLGGSCRVCEFCRSGRENLCCKSATASCPGEARLRLRPPPKFLLDPFQRVRRPPTLSIASGESGGT